MPRAVSAPHVYLAGPISGLSYDHGQEWRINATAKLRAAGINAFSPLRGKDHLRKEGILHSGSYDENPISSAKGILTRDRYDTCTADAVLANLLGAAKVSVGTMIELGWADSFRVPVILCIEPGNPHWHLLVMEIAGYVVESVDEGIEIVKTLLLPD